ATAPSSSTGRVAALREVVLTDRRRWFADQEDVRFLPRLRQAAMDRRRITMRHRSARSAASSRRTVDPWLVADAPVIELEGAGADSVTLEMTFRVRQAALGVLLGFAPYVELLCPADLRTELVETAHAAIAAHQRDG